MTERKPLSKKTRFEVFKRDRFTCQYCGKMAPDVILEVDHIKPVAEGGTNKMINLITACRDCNRGKGKRKLSDDVEIKKQQKTLVDLADKREQMEMMLRWREELDVAREKQIAYLLKRIGSWCEEETYNPSTFERVELKKLLNQFSIAEIDEAIDIAFPQYYGGPTDIGGWMAAVDSLGGICHNRRKRREGGADA